jgi:hypothetical protein
LDIWLFIMKVFILGRPQSGRSSVANALCQNTKYCYVDGSDWVKRTFRSKREGEHPEHYHDAYHEYVANKLQKDNNLCLRNIEETILNNISDNYIIDGIIVPRDFIYLFNPAQDFVVFLNRNDDEDLPTKDYEKIGVSVMRDYCFWLSAASLLEKNKWYEYNFKMKGGDPERFKVMGSKNSVFIVGSLDKVTEHLKNALLNLPVQKF